MNLKNRQNEAATLTEIILDEDKRLDQEIPGSAFGLVTFSYLGILAATSGAIIAYIGLA